MNLVVEIIWLLCRVFYYYIEALFRVFVPPTPKSVRGKVALVTGAGRGIGRAIALELSKHGAMVAVSDIDERLCNETVDIIRETGGTAEPYQCDVTKPAEVASTVAKIQKTLGDVSILVNNAGILNCKGILELNETEIRRAFEVNTISHFWTVRAVLPSMIASKSGHIVAICSMAGKETSQLMTDYCGSKQGTNGFMEALFDDLRFMKAQNIQLTTVYPMYVNTSMVQDLSYRSKPIEPRIRFDSVMTPEHVGQRVVDEVLLNRRYVYIPPIMYGINFANVVPFKVKIALKDFIGAGFFYQGQSK